MEAKVLLISLVRIIKRSITLLVLLLCLAQLLPNRQEADAGLMALPQAVPGPAVRLEAASGATIRFTSDNGKIVDGVSPKTSALPHLVLFRNGVLTDPQERTLNLVMTGIEVPSPGATVTLAVETMHGDPDPEEAVESNISVWQESRWIADSSATDQTSLSIPFTRVFTESVTAAAGPIATPTGYFRYRVTVVAGDRPLPSYSFSQANAFLMENQWIAPLPEVQEASPGAAPESLIIYYCDMFPFPAKFQEMDARLERRRIHQYIGTELVPAMIAAFRLQSDLWGFTWHREWSKYRSAEEARRLTVALTDGETWFHGPAPIQGNAQISLNLLAYEYSYYETLTEALLATFHHELFHNLQRDINLHHGGEGDVDGKEDAWQFFTEGTAVLAAVVAQPIAQFAPHSDGRFYLAEANAFLGDGGVLSDLNTSFERMWPYRAALYWRFLYERCGGLKDGVEDPAAGMELVRRTLDTLYRGDIVDVTLSTDLVSKLPLIMDHVLSGSPSCPFATYEQSLVRFSRQIYALHLSGGRCLEPGMPAGCGLYDPHHQYSAPPLDVLDYVGGTLNYDTAKQLYPAGIGGSFGMDFVDIILDPAVDGHPLKIELYAAPGSPAEFHVELWELSDAREGGLPRPVGEIATLSQHRQDGRQILQIPVVDSSECNRLGLIITRLDAFESVDPVGEYTLVIDGMG